ncbi:MAG: GNAT family N-acetyltransferase [Gemmatimonadetes bacterium]|nr:GNAT family N-acetyltransferase [Gemmatimonadota bacterium]
MMSSETSDLVVRLATVEDVSRLEQLVELSIRQLAAGYYDDRQIESSLQHLYGVDTQLVRDGTYYVVECQRQVVGCGGWSRRLTPFGGDNVGAIRDAGLRTPGQDPAVIRAFFVHPDWTRRGLGRKILETCEKAAQQAGYDRFELTATLMGRALYAACGYREIRPVDITLRDGQVLPHVLMEKP